MHRGILFALLVLGLLTPFSQGVSGQSSPKSIEKATCSEWPVWSESREELGGTYFGNGWEYGFLEVLDITTIGSSIAGFSTEARQDENGEIVKETSSVTGVFEGEEISLTIVHSWGGSTLLVGRWTNRGLLVRHVGSSGELVESGYHTANAFVATSILEAWGNQAPRDDAAALILDELTPAYVRLAQDADLSSALTLMSIDQAANVLEPTTSGEPTLLAQKWLASASFAYRTIGNLPNQLSTIQLHVVGSPSSGAILAACAIEALSSSDRQDLGKQFPEVDELWIVRFDGSSDIPGNITVVAVKGHAVATATIYGSLEAQEEGLEVINDILVSSSFGR